MVVLRVSTDGQSRATRRKAYKEGPPFISMTKADSITLRDDESAPLPAELRSLEGGDILIVVRDDDKLVLERVKELDEQLLEDLEFARRTREAWKRYERGEFSCLPFDEFLEEMKKW